MSARLEESWTEQQREAIKTIDRSVLVGAAAGSGKTATLARRCAYLVGEAPPDCRCDVDNLLVVTFTEAAASEMRSRIGRALRDLLESRPSDTNVRYQLAALDGAAVSTIHAFCRSILNRWFAAAGLDPGFDVLDPDEQLLLKQEAVDDVFAQLYEDTEEDGRRFHRFVDLYGDGSDLFLGERVISLSEYLNSIVDPSEWMGHARQWVSIRDSRSLPAGLSARYLERFAEELEQQKIESSRAAKLIRRRYPSAAYIADLLEGHAEALSKWCVHPGTRDVAQLDDVARAIREYEFPAKRGPRLPKDAHRERREREYAGHWHDRLKKVFQAGVQTRWSLFTVEEMCAGLTRSAFCIDVLTDLVARYDRHYQRLKEQAGGLDFADLERMTLNLLSAEGFENEVLGSLRDRFDYVLIDEYQDVNPVQEQIIRLVSRELEPGRRDNLFCVGDIKQSIYRFRLAEPEMFARREAQFQGDPESGAFVPLGKNFRSRPEIIDGINAVFERLMTRQFGPIEYDQHARLKAGLNYGPASPDSPALEMHLIERAPETEADSSDPEESSSDMAAMEVIEREAYLTGLRIRQLMGMERGSEKATVYEKSGSGTGPLQSRPMRWSDVVILMRSLHFKAEPFARVLSGMELPVHAELATGYFDSTEVLDLLSLLTLLDNRCQDIPLAAVMRSPLFEPAFSETDLVRIRSLNTQMPFHEVFRAYVHKGEDRDLADRCADLNGRLDRFREWVRRRPLADAIWQMYGETGCLSYVAGLHGGRQRRANLIKLHERARQFGSFSRQGLYRFCRFIEGLRESGQDLGTALPATESDDVVRIMSLHRSKGLEFPVVVLPDLNKRFNFEDARGRIVVSRECYIGPKVIDDELEVEYASAAHQLAVDDLETQTRYEELRLLYVGLTRARERIILIGSVNLEKQNPAILAAEWAGHQGPIPPLILSTANSNLDWLLPALICRRADTDATDPPWLAIQSHDGAEVRGWKSPHQLATDRREERAGYAQLAPLPGGEPVSERDATVQQTLCRITTPYDFDDLTAVPAALAVTELKRRHEATHELDEQIRLEAHVPPDSFSALGPSARDGSHQDGTAGTPGETGRNAAIDRGIAMHAILQHLDLKTATDPDRLAAQIDTLVHQRVLTERQSEQVDAEAVRWFLETKLGRSLSARPDRLRREVMFVSRVSPEEYDPSASAGDLRDVLLVRGIIDALWIDEQECRIIDYKTDALGSEGVPARAESYRTQMELYAQAAGELCGKPVAHKWLVFLTPRKVWELC